MSIVLMYVLYDSSEKYSGNKSTIKRLSKLLDIKISKNIQNNCIGLNALNFGKDIFKSNDNSIVNFITILGGTEIYDNIHKEEHMQLIKDTLFGSKWIISFNQDMKNCIIDKYSLPENKIRVIPQSISHKLKYSEYDVRKELNIKSNKKIYIMVGNLRPIKRPDYLFNYFEKKKKKVLIIIGKMDKYQYIFPKNVYHINGLNKKDVYACIKKADGLINCSINEGMPLAILEAMSLKCPVYAFKNPGNCAIVKDNFNGYLFSCEKTFDFILKLPTNKIVNNAYDYICVSHNKHNEKIKYEEILDI